MLSRIRDNAQHVFDCFCEVVTPNNAEEQPWIIQKFPDSYQNEETLKMVPQFTFPCDFERSTVQHFSFVLTSLDSKWTFGFCRHAPGRPTALVLLSAFPWHDTFFKLLNTLADLTASDDQGQLWTCLQKLHASLVPDRGGSIQVPLPDEKVFSVATPDHRSLPCIPQDRNLTEYFNAVDTNNMMVIFASMLYERRIVVTSRKLSRLSACVQAANAIIYPMSWQHIFIPVLPASLLDYLSAPMPFVIGASETVLKRAKLADIGDAIILDADNNRIQTPFNDLETLPTEVVSSLKRQLKNPNNMLGDGVARAFLRALVQLIGGYRDALRFPQRCAKITFDSEAFVRSRPPHIQPFLEKMLHLQIFHQFITERLDMLNSGQGFSDEFELEACLYSEKSSSRLAQQYKDWATTVRKEGGAFFKNVRSKTNPAIKSAVKGVKETGKSGKQKVRSAYKDIRSRLKDIQHASSSAPHLNGDDDDGSDQPHSAPSSPTRGRRLRGIQRGSSAVTYRRQPAAAALPGAAAGGRPAAASTGDLGAPLPPPRPAARSLSAALQPTTTSIKYHVIDSPPEGSSDAMLFQYEPPSVGSSLLDEVNQCLDQISEPEEPRPQSRVSTIPPRPSPSESSLRPPPARRQASPATLHPSQSQDSLPRPSSPPPPVPKPRTRRNRATTSESKEADLIRLDSTEEDPFDPLAARPRDRSLTTNGLGLAPSASVPSVVHNPVYPYCEPRLRPRPDATPAAPHQQQQQQPSYQQLLADYGLDFSKMFVAAQDISPATEEPPPLPMQPPPLPTQPPPLSTQSLALPTQPPPLPPKASRWTTFE